MDKEVETETEAEVRVGCNGRVKCKSLEDEAKKWANNAKDKAKTKAKKWANTAKTRSRPRLRNG